MVRNSITYTVQGSDRTRYEQTAVIDRPKTLTPAGAQRILRAEGKTSAIVSRVESMRYA